MHLDFYKYQGTGNDFVMIDNRHREFPKNDTKLVARLCDRKFGIGADGLILLENDADADFRMVYYNADGNESSMCGNGGRCIVAFARFLGIVEEKARFLAVDGIHHATVQEDRVCLQMTDVDRIEIFDNYVFLNTGSPHHVQEIKDIDHFDVKAGGEKLRYGKYGRNGSNINFVSPVKDNEFKVRTYERGVEDETLSCGTGVTAVAIAMHRTGKATGNLIMLDTPGGKLRVSFEEKNGKYEKVFLEGPATRVFQGKINVL
ncbi:diaminopimelate epimerase [Sinomicrobium weinanense]|uniref:Diaminopimelate epimerase n=1 Tax=Sinomicrobium weinanense TaxID=2842200 RepID=A0A926JWG1_9FLAO|nr:diaminopimelate epimerase [Sinomicrobium weinanense]MBC9798426.1 diaminopimelate epimerase [Sinomicrobium weinanense]MBU3122709.1 diaminopimelate epimerase [Sinomicrobium weinanense]